MSALQLWLQNHNRRLTQDAIDEALMEYITHVESQRDALKQQRDELLAALEDVYKRCALSDFGRSIVSAAITSVKEKA